MERCSDCGFVICCCFGHGFDGISPTPRPGCQCSQCKPPPNVSTFDARPPEVIQEARIADLEKRVAELEAMVAEHVTHPKITWEYPPVSLHIT